MLRSRDRKISESCCKCTLTEKYLNPINPLLCQLLRLLQGYDKPSHHHFSAIDQIKNVGHYTGQEKVNMQLTKANSCHAGSENRPRTLPF